MLESNQIIIVLFVILIDILNILNAAIVIFFSFQIFALGSVDSCLVSWLFNLSSEIRSKHTEGGLSQTSEYLPSVTTYQLISVDIFVIRKNRYAYFIK